MCVLDSVMRLGAFDDAAVNLRSWRDRVGSAFFGAIRVLLDVGIRQIR
jgi:hypothetical protein